MHKELLVIESLKVEVFVIDAQRVSNKISNKELQGRNFSVTGNARRNF